MLITNGGDNMGDNGQKRHGDTQEEVASQWMVAISMAIGAYSNHYYHQDGVQYQKNIDSQQLQTHMLREEPNWIMRSVSVHERPEWLLWH